MGQTGLTMPCVGEMFCFCPEARLKYGGTSDARAILCVIGVSVSIVKMKYFRQDFSATWVQDIPDEFRKEILRIEPVTLGTKYRFVGDEVDGVVGV